MDKDQIIYRDGQVPMWVILRSKEEYSVSLASVLNIERLSDQEEIIKAIKLDDVLKEIIVIEAENNLDSRFESNPNLGIDLANPIIPLDDFSVATMVADGDFHYSYSGDPVVIAVSKNTNNDIRISAYKNCDVPIIEINELLQGYKVFYQRDLWDMLYHFFNNSSDYKLGEDITNEI